MDTDQPIGSDVAERNIERLLVGAYRPAQDQPDPEFVARLRRQMIDAAAPSRRSRRILAWSTAAAAAALIVGIGIFLAVRQRHVNQQAPIAGALVTDPNSTRPSPSTRQAAPAADLTRPPLVERALTPRPRPPGPAVTPVASGESLRTAAGQRRRVELADGSVLYLNEGTVLRVDAPRRVTLEAGEVFVDVSPRRGGAADAPPAEPFVVSAPGREVTALGTKFSVRAESKGAGVFVAQGKVRVSGVADAVTAGQRLTPASNSPAPAPRASYELDWTRDLVAASESPLVPGSAYSGGALVAKDPAGGGAEARLSMRRYHVDVHVEDGFARTTIDQTYFNHQRSRLEGTFYFPLPPDAQLSRLAMYVEGKLMEGGMAEREHARGVYESIVSSQKDPALLEWIDGTTFRMRVFPLEPRQEKRIVLSYTQKLPAQYDRAEYRFPAGHSLGGVREWSFHARIKGGAAGGTRWESPSHELSAAKDGDDLLLDADAKHARFDRDVVVRLHDPGADEPAADGATRLHSAVHEGHRYLLLRHRPKLTGESLRRRRDWVFLFESSGDRDPLLARAQVDVVRSILSNAEHEDTFSILTAATRPRPLFEGGPRPATPQNVADAVALLESVHLVGALDLEAALKAVAPLLASGQDPHLVHVGGALPALGERRENVLAGLLPAGARYVGVGVGRRWSRSLMKAAAARGGGYYTQINPDEPAAWRGFELVSVLNAPRLLDVKVADDAGRAWLCHEDALAQGEWLCAVTRSDETGPLPRALTVTGTLGGKPFRQEIPVDPAAVQGAAGYAPRVWARLEIDRLLAADPAKNRSAIVELSKATYVMSPFTSLLVLENDEMYTRFNVDRGRKDHWAMYPCPDTIPVVKEDGDVVAARSNPIEPQGPPAPARKPTAEAVLRTIRVRVPPRMIDWTGGRAPHDRNGPYALGAAEVYAIAEDAQGRPGPLREHGLRTDDLIRAARSLIDDQRYRESLGVLDQILAIDPANDYAIGVRPLVWDKVQLREQREIRERSAPDLVDILNSAEEMRIPYDDILRYPADWPDISMLREWPVALERGEDLEDRAVVAQLDRRLPQLQFDGAAFTDVIDFLRDSSGANIVVNWRELEAAGVDRNAPVSSSLRSARFANALQSVLDSAGGGEGSPLGFRVDNGVVTVSTAEDLARHTVTRVYDVRDLIINVPDFTDAPDFGLRSSAVDGRWDTPPFFDPNSHWFVRPPFGNGRGGLFEDEPVSERDVAVENVMRLVTDTVATESWIDNGGPAGAIRELSGQLIVTQTPENHRKLAALLRGLRTGSPPALRDAWPRGWGALTYRKPAFTGDDRLFSDLLHYAPGMNTTAADVRAVIEAEANPGPDGAAGTVDPAARRLIEGSRAAGWRRVRIKAAPLPDFDVTFDGSSRYAYERELAAGLRERVVCDGRTLWHLYPDLGVGAKRAASRFHRAAFASLVPWALPPADDLARGGADVVTAGERTVAVGPGPAAGAATAQTRPSTRTEVRFVFDEDGRLAERQVVEASDGKSEVIVREMYTADGRVSLVGPDGKPAGELDLAAAPAEAPDLTPDVADLVVLPLPYRTIDHVKKAGADDARERDLELLAAALAASPKGVDVVQDTVTRFFEAGDRRAGFLTLMLSAGAWDELPDPLAGRRDSPLAQYVAGELRRRTADRTPPPKVAGDGFLARLAALRDFVDRSRDGTLHPADEAERDAEHDAVAAFARSCGSPIIGWAALGLLDNFAPLNAKTLRKRLDALESFEATPALRYAARYECARLLLPDRSDPTGPSKARDLFEKLFLETAERGVIPPMDRAFFDAFHAASPGSEAAAEDARRWSAMMRAALRSLLDRHPDGGVAGVSLAWQYATFGDRNSADDLIGQVLAVPEREAHGGAAAERRNTRLAAVAYFWHTGRHARADDMLRPLLEDAGLSRRPQLWRLGAALAGRRGMTAQSLQRLERALELEYDAPGETVDLGALRREYGRLLAGLRGLADAIRALEQRPPADFAARVVRAADRWRSLDVQRGGADACRAAADVLRSLGETELAWDYLSTPLAARSTDGGGADVQQWSQLARGLAEQGDTDLADRAYAAAAAADPADAQVRWDRANLLQQAGRFEDARAVFRELAEGNWPPQHRWIQQAARERLN